MIPRLNTYFSGGGLMDLGLQRGGVEIQQSFEIDALCCRTLRANFGHEVVQCDIKDKLVAGEKDCDVMVATYPCNRYSPIGDIHGVRTGDELFLHFFRHVALKLPECYVLENVPGMKKFPVVMEAMTKLPDYYVNVFCPVQSEMWLPQRRNRLIIIGSRRAFEWNKPRARRRVRLAEILARRAENVYNQWIEASVETKSINCRKATLMGLNHFKSGPFNGKVSQTTLRAVNSA